MLQELAISQCAVLKTKMWGRLGETRQFWLTVIQGYVHKPKQMLETANRIKLYPRVSFKKFIEDEYCIFRKMFIYLKVRVRDKRKRKRIFHLPMCLVEAGVRSFICVSLVDGRGPSIWSIFPAALSWPLTRSLIGSETASTWRALQQAGCQHYWFQLYWLWLNTYFAYYLFISHIIISTLRCCFFFLYLWSNILYNSRKERK